VHLTKNQNHDNL